MKAIVYQPRPAGWLACRLLGRLWPGCLTSPLAGLSLRPVEPPSLPGGDWVLLRTLLAGICGSDLALIAQKPRPDSILQAYSSMPMVLGHEAVATVEKAGRAVDPAWVGRRVVVDPGLPCAVRGIEPPCAACLAGHFSACASLGLAGEGTAGLPAGTSIGYNRRTAGSFAEFFVAHKAQLLAVPEGLSDEAALLVDPLACSLHAVLRADLGAAKRVLVHGAGMIGLGVVMALRAAGFAGQVHVLGRHRYLCELARLKGADEAHVLPPGRAQQFELVARLTAGGVRRVRLGNLVLEGGYDVSFDCIASPASIEQCLKWTAGRGQVVLAGTGDGRGADLTSLWLRELTVRGANGRALETVDGRRIGTSQLTLEWLANGRLNPKGLLTHLLGLEQYRRAMAVGLAKARHGAVKVGFDMRG